MQPWVNQFAPDRPHKARAPKEITLALYCTSRWTRRFAGTICDHIFRDATLLSRREGRAYQRPTGTQNYFLTVYQRSISRLEPRRRSS